MTTPYRRSFLRLVIGCTLVPVTTQAPPRWLRAIDGNCAFCGVAHSEYLLVEHSGLRVCGPCLATCWLLVREEKPSNPSVRLPKFRCSFCRVAGTPWLFAASYMYMCDLCVFAASGALSSVAGNALTALATAHDVGWTDAEVIAFRAASRSAE